MHVRNILLLSNNGIVTKCVEFLLTAATPHRLTSSAYDRPLTERQLRRFDLLLVDATSCPVAEKPKIPLNLPEKLGVLLLGCKCEAGLCAPEEEMLHLPISAPPWLLVHTVEAELSKRAGLPHLPMPGSSGKSMSATERTILDLIADGFSNQQIASRMGIAQATVRVHKLHMSRKLGVRGSVQLHQYACEVRDGNSRHEAVLHTARKVDI